MPRQLSEVWPPLPFDAWRDTQATLHRWTQVVGKVKLATTPFQNEWWNVAFSVTSTGITTGLMPYGNEAFSIDFDFVDHNLYVRVSDGQTKTMSLLPRSVAEFYAEIFAVLGSLGIDVSINPLPVEIVDPVEFHMDHENESYDADAVHRWWRIQMQTAKVMQRYQTPFGGKSSPVMFSGVRSTLRSFAFPGDRLRSPRMHRTSCNSPRIRKISRLASGREMTTMPVFRSASQDSTPISFRSRMASRRQRCDRTLPTTMTG